MTYQILPNLQTNIAVMSLYQQTRFLLREWPQNRILLTTKLENAHKPLLKTSMKTNLLRQEKFPNLLGLFLFQEHLR
ncbi:unnamed protein product [Schistosoma curassoni]|uniref:Ovule protein n=1 Tax=Schistosoma curassoni TaxID=6186 RepID=A0A183JNN1_9TREM|nr:unnamed protein product [Schistosoma curassoni]